LIFNKLIVNNINMHWRSQLRVRGFNDFSHLSKMIYSSLFYQRLSSMAVTLLLMNCIVIVPLLTGTYNSKWDDENLENLRVHVFVSFVVTTPFFFAYSCLPSWSRNYNYFYFFCFHTDFRPTNSERLIQLVRRGMRTGQ